jgi:hypothetical protein
MCRSGIVPACSCQCAELSHENRMVIHLVAERRGFPSAASISHGDLHSQIRALGRLALRFGMTTALFLIIAFIESSRRPGRLNP